LILAVHTGSLDVVFGHVLAGRSQCYLVFGGRVA
jgi:hypothetical protein